MTQKPGLAEPPNSASTRTPEHSVGGVSAMRGSFEGIRVPSGSPRRRERSMYVSIVVVMGERG